MTEHFGDEFSLMPNLSEIATAADPPGVVGDIETRTVAGRCVTAFTLVGRGGETEVAMPVRLGCPIESG